MNRKLLRLVVAMTAATIGVLAVGAAQAQGPVGQGAPDATAFVCPVLGGQAGENENLNAHHFVAIGEGDHTVLGPNVSVPEHATNANGTGSPR
jgi:hypothetical protein